MTKPLPRCPVHLEIGAEVIIARPENPGPYNKPGRRGRVIKTSLYEPAPKVVVVKGKQVRLEPIPPRLFVLVEITTGACFDGDETWKWADELDVVI